MVNIPLAARREGDPLRTLIIGRISTPHQREESIDASYEFDKKHLERIYDGPAAITCLGERASGMVADRRTIREAEDMIAAGKVDLLLVEDVGRIYRDPRHLIAFVNDTVDAGVRLIAINDTLDTAEDDWEVVLAIAMVRHGFAATDAKKRVRRTATYAFQRGGDVRKVVFGYRKLTKEESVTGIFGPVGLRMAKIAECTPFILQMRDMVLAGCRYEAIASWLNSIGIKPGPYVKKGHWTAKLVISFLRRRLLRGERELRKVIHQRIRKTGKHLRVKNPNPERKQYPELAHLTAEEHDELLAKMDVMAEGRRHWSGDGHPRWRVPRSKGIWPSALDGICSACEECTYVYGNDQLKCSNSFSNTNRPCWNHVQTSRERIRQAVIPWLWKLLEECPGARSAFLEAAWTQIESQRDHQSNALTIELQQAARLEKEAERLGVAIAQGGNLSTLLVMLQGVERGLAESKARCTEMKTQLPLKQSIDHESFLRNPLEATLELARTSLGFGELMRRVVTELVVIPVQDLLHGQVRPRVKVTVEFAGDENLIAPAGPIVRTMAFDAFDAPQYIRLIDKVQEFRRVQPTATYEQLAGALGIKKDVLTRTIRYVKLMARRGIAEPYVELTTKPARASRWRHRAVS